MSRSRKAAVRVRSPVLALGMVLLYALTPFLLPPLMDREANVAIMDARFGPFQWHKQALFEDEGHVDHLFIGNSALLHGVIPEEVEAGLRDRMPGSREVRVLNLSHMWNGSLLDYFLFSEFLKRRTCDVVYFTIPDTTARPHSGLKYLFSWSELPKGARLPFRSSLQIYAEQLLITPRLLINQTIPIDRQPGDEEMAGTRGYEAKKLGYRDGKQSNVREPYREDLPLAFAERPMDGFLRAGKEAATESSLRVVRTENRWQEVICDMIAAKAVEHGVEVVFVDTPQATHDSGGAFGEQVVFVPASGHRFRTISIPEAVLFSSVERHESRHYFYNYEHLNDSGAVVFSRALAALIYQCGLDQTP